MYSINSCNKYNFTNLLRTSPLYCIPSGLYSTAQVSVFVVKISVATKSGRSTYLRHLSCFFTWSHESTGLKKTYSQMTQLVKVKSAGYEDKSTNNLACALQLLQVKCIDKRMIFCSYRQLQPASQLCRNIASQKSICQLVASYVAICA